MMAICINKQVEENISKSKMAVLWKWNLAFFISVFRTRNLSKHQYLSGYMSDSHQISYTCRGLSQDLALEFLDDLKKKISFYGFFNFKQKNLLSWNLNKENS